MADSRRARGPHLCPQTVISASCTHFDEHTLPFCALARIVLLSCMWDATNARSGSTNRAASIDPPKWFATFLLAKSTRNVQANLKRDSAPGHTHTRKASHCMFTQGCTNKPKQKKTIITSNCSDLSMCKHPPIHCVLMEHKVNACVPAKQVGNA